MTLGEILDEAARRFGDRVALIRPNGERVTYAELHRRSDELAAGLSRVGVGEGSAVALVLPSDLDYALCYLAAAKLGAITAGTNPFLSDPERERVLERLQPDFVLRGDAVGTLAIRGEAPSPLPHDPERVVTIVFTSGTVGEPKGAVFRQRQLDAIAAIDLGTYTSGDEPPWGGGGPMLSGTQFPHIGFMTKLPWYLRSGATLVCLEKWRAADALRAIAEHQMRSVGGVAAQIGLLLRVPDFDDHDVSSVQTIVIGGGPSPAALVEEAERRFGAAYSIRYSSTESGGVGTGTAFDAPDDEKLFTCGRPRPGVELRIDDGELLLRSPAMFDGYWNDPEQTAATLVDGWLRTGDLGEIDDAGRLRIVGRRNDMYIRGGYNVHPAEVEAVLLDHPAVAQVVVVPRPDDVMGEIGVAVVVTAAGCEAPTVEELRTFAENRLAEYKLPEAVRVVDALPVTSMDKIDRRALTAAETQPRT